MNLLDRVKAIREKHNRMKADGTSSHLGWETIDNMLADAIRDYETKNWPPPKNVFYCIGGERKPDIGEGWK